MSIPGSEDPLEKGVATHSGILAWRFPRTVEPGGLQSMGFQKGRTQPSSKQRQSRIKQFYKIIGREGIY